MRTLDLGVILAYLIGITWFGSRFRSGQKSLKDYFLGGRTAPWWAIAFSIVSAETSTLTVIGTPGIAFRGDLGFLQVVMGYFIARLVISTLFLPHYFRGEMYTAYELMQRFLINDLGFNADPTVATAGNNIAIRLVLEGMKTRLKLIQEALKEIQQWSERDAKKARALSEDLCDLYGKDTDPVVGELVKKAKELLSKLRAL